METQSELKQVPVEMIGTNHITLKRSTKGIYSWEIKVYSEKPLPLIEKLDLELKKRYTSEVMGAQIIGPIK